MNNSNNNRMNVVCEILKMRGGDRICVRTDLKGATFDNTSVPLVADLKGILMSFFTNANEIVSDLSWRGYFGISAIYLNEAKYNDSVDTDLLLMSVKANDKEKVLKLLAA